MSVFRRDSKLLRTVIIVGLLLSLPLQESPMAEAQSIPPGAWQRIPRGNIIAPSLTFPTSPSPVAMPSPTSAPTFGSPVGGVATPRPAFSSFGGRSPGPNLGWDDLGDGTKIRLLRDANGGTTLKPVSLEGQAPLQGFPSPTYQLAPAVTGAQPQPLMAPAGGQPQTGTFNQPDESTVILGNSLKLSPEQNLEINSLDLRDEDVGRALRSLAQLINLNIMLNPGVSGNVTILFSKVSLEEAFNTLLRSFDLGFAWEGNILRIFPNSAAPLMTAIFTIQNTNAAQAKGMIDKLLTPTRGRSEVDARTNSLMVSDTQAVLNQIRKLLPQIDIQETQVDVTARPTTEVFYLDYVDANNIMGPIRMITPAAEITAYSSSQGSMAAAGAAGAGRMDMMIISDTPNNLGRIRELIEKLDIAPIQVTIDARIIEINLDDQEKVGFNWQKAIPIAGSTDTLFSGTIAPESSDAGGSGVFRFGTLGVNQFSALLAMLATKSFAKVISNPMITTLNNKQAVITVGQQVPYIETTTSQGTGGTVTAPTTKFVNADITLEVTPSVTGNEEVFLDIHPTVTNVQGAATSNSAPPTATRDAKTQVIIKNGHTIVIGGMIKTDKTEGISKVPFFSAIPGIGKLFQKKTISDVRTELIIFITPHIVRRALDETPKRDTMAQREPRLTIQP